MTLPYFPLIYLVTEQWTKGLKVQKKPSEPGLSNRKTNPNFSEKCKKKMAMYPLFIFLPFHSQNLNNLGEQQRLQDPKLRGVQLLTPFKRTAAIQKANPSSLPFVPCLPFSMFTIHMQGNMKGYKRPGMQGRRNLKNHPKLMLINRILSQRLRTKCISH